MNDFSNSEQVNSFGLKQLMHIAHKRIKLIISIYLTSLFILAIYNYISRPYFETNILIISNTITSAQTTNLINDLNLLIKSSRFSKLSELLNIDKAILQQIKDLSITQIKDKNDNYTFILLLSVYESQAIPEITQGIYLYINNNYYIKNKVDGEKQKLTLLIDKIRKELNALDGLKAISQNMFKNEKNNYGAILDPSSVHLNIVKLYEMELNYSHRLSNFNAFDIINTPVIPDKPIKIGTLSNILLVSFVSLSFAILLSIYLELKL